MSEVKRAAIPRSKSAAALPLTSVLNGKGQRELIDSDDKTQRVSLCTHSPHLEALRSIGSLGHKPGNCSGKRCYWFFSKQGCSRGWLCDHCHYCQPVSKAPREKAFKRPLSDLRGSWDRAVSSSSSFHGSRATGAGPLVAATRYSPTHSSPAHTPPASSPPSRSPSTASSPSRGPPLRGGSSSSSSTAVFDRQPARGGSGSSSSIGSVALQFRPFRQALRGIPEGAAACGGGAATGGVGVREIPRRESAEPSLQIVRRDHDRNRQPQSSSSLGTSERSLKWRQPASQETPAERECEREDHPSFPSVLAPPRRESTPVSSSTVSSSGRQPQGQPQCIQVIQPPGRAGSIGVYGHARERERGVGQPQVLRRSPSETVTEGHPSHGGRDISEAHVQQQQQRDGEMETHVWRVRQTPPPVSSPSNRYPSSSSAVPQSHVGQQTGKKESKGTAGGEGEGVQDKQKEQKRHESSRGRQQHHDREPEAPGSPRSSAGGRGAPGGSAEGCPSATGCSGRSHVRGPSTAASSSSSCSQTLVHLLHESDRAAMHHQSSAGWDASGSGPVGGKGGSSTVGKKGDGSWGGKQKGGAGESASPPSCSNTGSGSNCRVVTAGASIPVSLVGPGVSEAGSTFAGESDGEIEMVVERATQRGGVGVRVWRRASLSRSRSRSEASARSPSLTRCPCVTGGTGPCVCSPPPPRRGRRCGPGGGSSGSAVRRPPNFRWQQRMLLHGEGGVVRGRGGGMGREEDGGTRGSSSSSSPSGSGTLGVGGGVSSPVLPRSRGTL
uniref:Uncharacterized protein n=1 Tax=Chromera velia CCMP2878 TaxID=1169474 RepID=A0A0G4FAU2_9ALVE|eukprot:Cvel_15952.t1-p1 / transcript=Cvel_15952.t1 / gene=Cvel_15952 / organism=Chromera_velia_CCMP2878 / gene_product=hypothetical protein / transcript_product=hypothetical protein / location=Cvel_scaffold1207:2523-5140(-) / protein_length=779 / sequence_SO=supercontig / SO=protein_coding / is_pseudo=false